MFCLCSSPVTLILSLGNRRGEGSKKGTLCQSSIKRLLDPEVSCVIFKDRSYGVERLFH